MKRPKAGGLTSLLNGDAFFQVTLGRLARVTLVKGFPLPVLRKMVIVLQMRLCLPLKSRKLPPLTFVATSSLVVIIHFLCIVAMAMVFPVPTIALILYMLGTCRLVVIIHLLRIVADVLPKLLVILVPREMPQLRCVGRRTLVRTVFVCTTRNLVSLRHRWTFAPSVLHVTFAPSNIVCDLVG